MTEQLPYSRSRFVECIAKRNHFTPSERDRAAWAIRELEMWARTKPKCMPPTRVSYCYLDEDIDEAADVALEHLYSQWPFGFPFGFITWHWFFPATKLAAVLWVREMYENDAAYSIVMEG